MLDFNTYQAKAMSTAIYPEDAKLIYPALGLSGEAGEFCGKIAKAYRDNNGEISEELRLKLIDELGDVLWMCAACAEDLGSNLGYIANRNIDKLRDRAERGVLSGSGDER
jgi:NTP pyrophosphatase (non-canonical NTP hydrolase)